MDRKPPGRASKVKPKLVIKCGTCGTSLGNPLTHRCVTRTDWKKRKRQAEKPAPRPKPAGNAHEYAACDDDDCPRFQCRVYKEGRADGEITGRQHGEADGYAKGYGDGFSDGVRSCPLPHQG